ncbi:hypothetical protein QR680_011943 [Steinernema hermaphroditum]|uniref:Uncharacterized protein n=1 Tax=Steinernema hermaphroditum TaxID=289476 RepID=A0AA39I0A8_9BILA|nr:hypothetical protein QR680_011943 [Steinernema hermaphroditum]
MEFTPIVFIEAVISHIPDYEPFHRLSGYWSTVVPTRTILHAWIDVADKTMSLVNCNPKTMDYRKILIGRGWGSSYFIPFNTDDYVKATTSRQHTRRGSALAVRDVEKGDLPLNRIFNSIDGNFSFVRMYNVKGYCTDIYNLLVRISEHRLPDYIEITHSELTEGIMHHILDSCLTSKSSHVTLRLNSTRDSSEIIKVTKQQMESFFSEWNKSPYPLSLLVDCLEFDGMEVAGIFGMGYYRRNSIQPHRACRGSDPVWIHRHKNRRIYIGKSYLSFKAREKPQWFYVMLGVLI